MRPKEKLSPFNPKSAFTRFLVVVTAFAVLGLPHPLMADNPPPDMTPQKYEQWIEELAERIELYRGQLPGIPLTEAVTGLLTEGLGACAMAGSHAVHTKTGLDAINDYQRAQALLPKVVEWYRTQYPKESAAYWQGGRCHGSYTLTVKVTPQSDGWVVGTAISCGQQGPHNLTHCTTQQPRHKVMQLTAHANRWLKHDLKVLACGDCDDYKPDKPRQNATLSVKMNRDRTITVVFD